MKLEFKKLTDDQKILNVYCQAMIDQPQRDNNVFKKYIIVR